MRTEQLLAIDFVIKKSNDQSTLERLKQSIDIRWCQSVKWTKPLRNCCKFVCKNCKVASSRLTCTRKKEGQWTKRTKLTFTRKGKEHVLKAWRRANDGLSWIRNYQMSIHEGAENIIWAKCGWKKKWIRNNRMSERETHNCRCFWFGGEDQRRLMVWVIRNGCDRRRLSSKSSSRVVVVVKKPYTQRMCSDDGQSSVLW